MIKALDEALQRRKRFLQKNIDYKKAEELLHRHNTGKYIGDLIYGSNDGLITTFSIIASAAGAGLPGLVIVILGLANITADGISMGASNYLGIKSELEYAKNQREKERWEIQNLPELEIKEIREILASKGFRGEDLDKAVGIITSNEEVWLDMMMKEEIGIIVDEKDDPIKHSLATFLAFVVIGAVPILPFLVPGLQNQFLVATTLTGITLFLVGALRSLVTTVSFFRGGLEMFLIGSFAATVAYLIGYFIDNLVR